MADKLSWTELRKALASRAGASEKEARLFLEALNAQIVEGLKTDKQVKVNGIGTFRLQAVAPRKSVNINTGEEITIEGYTKMTFTPEVGVKELVEKNRVSPKPSEAKVQEEIDPLKKLGEQAAEIVDILADLGQAPKKEEKKKAKGRRKKEEAEPILREPVAPLVEQIQEEKPYEAPVEEPKAEEPKVAEPVKEVEPVVAVEKPKKQYHFLRDTLICVVCLLVILLVTYFFLRRQLTNWMDSLGPKDGIEQPELIEPAQAEEPIEAIEMPTDTLAAEEETVAEEEVVVVTKTEPEPEVAPKEIVYERWITTEPMHEASRLTWMAKRYYGNKAMWVYLYDANKDRIKNPNAIAVGTPIRVPKLTQEQMDTTLESTRQTLERLREAAEAACK